MPVCVSLQSVRMKPLVFAFVLLTACAAQSTPPQPQPPVQAQSQLKPPAEPPPNSMEAKTAKLQHIDGFLPLYWDAENGKRLMRITHLGEELIYSPSLAAGVGSNPLGLDRAGLGETFIIRFDRVGPKALMVAPNYRYRAISSDPGERRSAG